MSNPALRAIPWSHESGEMGAVWQWDTPHFRVVVNGNVRSCYYRIEDKSTGQIRPFEDGQAGTFDQAELLIRETIGKAYPPDLGYQVYAGYLATTFTIASGKKMDFAQYIGRKATVRVLQPDGQRKEYVGIVRVSHYNVKLSASNNVELKIFPSYIESVEPHVERKTEETNERVFGRTYKGRVTKGCNGKPGFTPGLVDHDGLSCPIHEE